MRAVESRVHQRQEDDDQGHHYPDPDFVPAVSDDRRDEDLFERMPDGTWTVHVGAGPTRAAFMVRDFGSVRSLIESFTGTQRLKRA